MLADQLCRKCGGEVNKNDKFCKHCGETVTLDAAKPKAAGKKAKGE